MPACGWGREHIRHHLSPNASDDDLTKGLHACLAYLCPLDSTRHENIHATITCLCTCLPPCPSLYLLCARQADTSSREQSRAGSCFFADVLMWLREPSSFVVKERLCALGEDGQVPDTSPSYS